MAKKRNRWVRITVNGPFYKGVVLPLLSMFEVVDSVYTTNDELMKSKAELEDLSKRQLREVIIEQQKSIGQIYEEWKICRKALDPEFDPDAFSRGVRPRRWLPKVVRESRRHAKTNTISSSEKTSISEKRKGGKSGRPSPKHSAKSASSGSRASKSRSSTTRSTASKER